MEKTKKSKRKLKLLLVLFLLAAAVLGFTAWYKFFREVPQPDFATPEERFMYGSIGGEYEAGLPYWIFVVMPRMFPEYLPGPGGLASLGVAWEEGKEMPIGFPKRTIGFPRVGTNCAVCHTASYRKSEDSPPVFITAAPGHTIDIQGYFSFITKVAQDPRFNPENVMEQINMVTNLSWLDKIIYRFLLIPIVKKRLAEQAGNFDWMNRPNMPPWSRGRDDPMNLTKYFMLEMEEDGTYGPADMPSIWNLNKYKPEQGMTMNWDGATHNARSVIMDSALGIVVKPHSDFIGHIDWLEEYLGSVPAPKYPFDIHPQKATAGKIIFQQNCAACHASERTGTSVPITEVGTDDERLKSWNKEAAAMANEVATGLGVTRKGMVEETMTGYIAQFLDGIWLRAPYLHNGSVPTIRDLLEPVANRPGVFNRGYDVYDSVNVGFVTQGEKAEIEGVKFSVADRGNSNRGHEYGTQLSPDQKDALVEYMKIL